MHNRFITERSLKIRGNILSLWNFERRVYFLRKVAVKPEKIEKVWPVAITTGVMSLRSIA